MSTSDVVVVGAGVIGASIAWHLAKAGAAVTLIDRAGVAAAPSATWASAGGLRSQGRHGPEQVLSLMASRRWPTLGAELDADLEARFGGHLHIAETEAEAEVVRRRVAADVAAGITIEAVDAAALRRIAPGLTRTAIAGAWTPGDGQAHPARTAAAYAAALKRLGGTVRLSGAARLRQEGGRVTGIEDDGGRLAARTVVLATGAWTIDLLASVGLSLPIRWRALEMIFSEVAAPALAPTITGVGRNLSLKQVPSGQYMLGGAWLVPPDRDAMAATPSQAQVDRHWAVGVAVWPALGALAMAQVWAGIEAQSIDALPFIGPSALPGLYVAAGFSNHGFQISPAVGELVAADLAGTAPSLLAPFRPDRAETLAAGEIDAFLHQPIP